MYDLSPDYWKKISPFSFSFLLPSVLAHKVLLFPSHLERWSSLTQKNSIGKNRLYFYKMMFHENI